VSARLVVLASGTGTLLQSLIDAIAGHGLDAQLVAVGSDDASAMALDRARDAGIPVFSLAPAEFPDRAAWNEALTEMVASFEPDWVVCAGFMRILGPAFVAEFRGRIVNTHPALLPSFPGAHAVRDALAHGVKVTGCTVHLVDDGVDTGPILAQRALAIGPDENEADLHERIKELERPLLVQTLALLIGEDE
jgi:phosphoribosylglycinamide formyltransferase 1